MTATALLLLVPLAAAPPAEPAHSRSKPLAAQVADVDRGAADRHREAAPGRVRALLKARPKASPPCRHSRSCSARRTPPRLLRRRDPRGDRPGREGSRARAARAAAEGTGGCGHGTEHIALALAKIDGPKIEATRVLLLAHARVSPNLLAGSESAPRVPEQGGPAPGRALRRQGAGRAGEGRGVPRHAEGEAGREGVPSVALRTGRRQHEGHRPGAGEVARRREHGGPARRGAGDRARRAGTDRQGARASSWPSRRKKYEKIRHGIHAERSLPARCPEKAAKVLIPLFDHPRRRPPHVGDQPRLAAAGPRTDRGRAEEREDRPHSPGRGNRSRLALRQRRRRRFPR